MVSFGLECSRNTLCAVNTVYLLIGLSVVVAAAYGKGLGLVSSLSLISAALTLGVFLIFISIMGLVGALRQNQLLLFVYVLLLVLVSITQLSVAFTSLSLSREKLGALLSTSWGMLGNSTRRSLEQQLDCCGFSSAQQEEFRMDVNLCTATCKGSGQCFSCGDLMLHGAAETLAFLGAVGFFSGFSELLVVWLTLHYRNLRKQNPVDPQNSL